MKNRNMHIIWIIFLYLFFITACGGGSSGGTSDKPKIYLDQSSIDFAGTVVDNYIDRTINISNSGNTNLNIGQISSPDPPFSISSDTSSNTTLAPLETCSLKVRFSPTSQGSYTGTFSIPSNDPDSATATIDLSGDGYGLNVWISKINFSNCPTITIDVTVTSPSGPLDSLEPDNFQLKLNGMELGAFNVSNYETDPVSIVMALDFSGSVNQELEIIKEAAQHFINLLGNTDEAAICKFKDEIEFFPDTDTSPFLIETDETGKADLNNYIDSPFDVTDGTALYDAVYDSVDRAVEGNNNKLAVIVLSDGIDNKTGGKTIDEVIDNAITEGIPIFSIYYVDIDLCPNASPDIMHRLAEDTGGQYYNSGDSTELQSIFEQISNVLSNKYTITYSSSVCTGSIDLEVRAESGGYYGLDTRTIIFQ